MPEELPNQPDQISLSTLLRWMISAFAILTVAGGAFWMNFISDQIGDTRIRIEKLENTIITGADKNSSVVSSLQIDVAVLKMKIDQMERQIDRNVPDGDPTPSLKKKSYYLTPVPSLRRPRVASTSKEIIRKTIEDSLNEYDNRPTGLCCLDNVPDSDPQALTKQTK